MKIFVTGTDTNVGKTLVSLLLCLRTGYRYWKPIQAGTSSQTDTQWVVERLGNSSAISETYCLSTPAAPSYAAEIDNVEISLDHIVKQAPEDHRIIIEGCGGILVPLNSSQLVLDLIEKLNARVVLVCKGSLGTINHTLLALYTLQQRKIDVAGIVFSGDTPESTVDSIKAFGSVSLLGQIPTLYRFDIEELTKISHLLNLETL